MGNQQNHNPQAIRQKPIDKTQTATGSGTVVGSSMAGGGGKVSGGFIGGKPATDTGSRGKTAPTKTGKS